MSADCCNSKGAELAEIAARKTGIRRVLVIVLVLNAVMFCVEFAAGMVAGSAALIADSADMFGDALVYALSLYALDRSERWTAGAALAKGGFILILGLAVLGQIGTKLVYGSAPESTLMLVFGGIALLVNLACLRMLWQFRNDNVNLSSTFECSRNDVIANIGVLAAGAGVALSNSIWPDVAIAVIIASVFLRSAFHVLAEAWPQFRHAEKS